MKNPKQSSSGSLGESLKSVFAAVVIPLELVLGYLIYFFVLGNTANFVGGDPHNHPIEGNCAPELVAPRIAANSASPNCFKSVAAASWGKKT